MRNSYNAPLKQSKSNTDKLCFQIISSHTVIRMPCRIKRLNRIKKLSTQKNMFLTMLRITLKRKEYERGQRKTLHVYKHTVFDFTVMPIPFPHLHQTEPKLSPATSQEVTVTHIP